MKVVGISSCPVGIAHTYMCAQNMTDACKELGYEVKIETQGQIGIENRLSEADIEEADIIIFSNNGGLSGRDRFEGYEDKTYNLVPDKIMEGPEYVIEELKKITEK